MATARVERRLAAILAADVVGYSRLVEQDEAATLAALKDLRRAVIDPLLAEHHGRIVKLMGDGALVEFGSVVDAVVCAVAVQRGAAEHQAGVLPARRIVFRIGVNLGDVVVEGEDIYGDGVNVAARLEGLAQPGGVLVSGTAYDHLKGRLGLPLEFAGEQRLKNIAEPVRAYRVRLDGKARRLGLPRLRRARRLALPALAALLVLVVVAGIGGWWLWPAGPAASGKPSIAVLPFDNLGGDEATGRLADGLTEDTITDLARFRGLDVIARNSTAVYEGKPVDVRRVGEDLNVGYVLEGSIQRQAERVRVTAQLIDASTGAHVWSDRWDRPTADVFAVQAEMAEKVSAALGGDLTMGQITRAELQRAKRLRPADLRAYDYFLLGNEAKSTPTKESIPRGIDYLTKAVALDPQLARAYSVRAWLYFFSMLSGADATAMLANMAADAEKAVQLDPQDAESLATLAYAHLLRGRYGEAAAQFRSALAMSPANSHVLILAASGLALLGKPEEGASLGDRALRLDPLMVPANLGGVKDAYFMARRYDDTVAAVERMPEASRTRDCWVFLTASYARLGRAREHAAAKAKLLQAFPSISAERSLNEDYVFVRKEDEDFFIESFRVAGLPVCMTAEEIARMPGAKPRPECEAERAKAAASKT